MEETKVAMNLKEGIIEVGGPTAFVGYCLDMYELIIKGVQGLPQDAAVRAEKAQSLPRKRRGKGSMAQGPLLPRLSGSMYSQLRAGW